MKIRSLIWIFLSCVIVGAGIWVVSSDSQPQPKPIQASGHTRKIKRRRPVRVSDLKERRDFERRTKPVVYEKARKNRSFVSDELSPYDRKLVDGIDVAVNDEDFDSVLKFVTELSKSTNEVARLRAVEALGWFDDRALPELTPFLMDPNEDVRDAAHDQWLAALDQVEDLELKGSVIEATMNTIKDPDLVEDIAFHLKDLPQTEAVDILVTLINQGEDVAAEVAIEEYSFITGESYTSIEDAQKWVDENPDDDPSEEDMPVYRASLHPEVFDERTDLTGIKIINDTEYEIPPRAKRDFDESVQGGGRVDQSTNIDKSENDEESGEGERE